MALLGFMVFLFYIIYRQVDKMLTFEEMLHVSFLNNSGNGRRSLDEETETVMVALVKFHESGNI